MTRYDRQTILREVGEDGQNSIAKAKVLVVGMGGLGSPISLYLAGAGIGTIGIVDADQVSITNLQRQVLYAEAQVGQPKVQCAAQRLNALNSTITIEPHNTMLNDTNAAQIISHYDMVIDGCDNYQTRYTIDKACKNLCKPYIYGAIRAFEGQVSTFTYRDNPFAYTSLYPQPPTTPPSPQDKGVLGITPGIVGCVQALEAIKLICGFGDTLLGKLWTIDLRSMQSHTLTLPQP